MSYTKQSFQSGATLYASQLNAMDDQIAANETAAAGKYTKPPTGIPDTDLSEAVQTRLDKADTALQAVPNTYRTAAAQDEIDGAQDAIDGAQDAAIASKYSKPGTGIPESDLSSDVQAKLNAAGGIPDAVKTALLLLAQKAAYADDSGPTVYTTLYNALNSTVSLSSISAVMDGTTIYEYNTIDDVAAHLTVTAHYSDSTSAVISTGYTLSGTLAIGTSVVTVSYQGKTTTVNMTVASALPSGYTRLQYVEADGNQYIDTGCYDEDITYAIYDIAITQFTDKGGHILSARNTYFPFCKGLSGDKIGMKNRGNETTESGNIYYTWALNTRYTVEAYPDIVINGVTVETLNASNYTNRTDYFYLFCYGGDPSQTRYRFYGKLYHMRTYNNGTLTRYFIPAKNGSNVAGLYDPISTTFYTSGSGTALIAGEVAV